ncbi:uncharacterized protein LOC124167174 [Ischnura elegans]|uniref:uncharacterized protein LOC124167174 n=1 Tax=Ischnura elegans TaxID=197161 RepID=UPI001ED8B5CB|nr:uncharacterized protein LOC124167174 [Ischnura elegans]
MGTPNEKCSLPSTAMITALIPSFVLVGVILANLLDHSCGSPPILSGEEEQWKWKSSVTGDKGGVIKREKRYVTFPEGSTLSIVWCFTTTTINMDGIHTFSLGFGLSYDLPNETKALNGDDFQGHSYEPQTTTPRVKYDHKPPYYYNDHDHHEHEYIITQRRRDRRDIFRKLEVAIDTVGLPGRSCLLRALCEGSSRLSSNGGFLEEMLKIIFTIPQVRKSDSRGTVNSESEWRNTLDEDQDIYDKAFLLGARDEKPECELYFPYCDVSIWNILIPR